jgi:hypothetical protein
MLRIPAPRITGIPSRHGSAAVASDRQRSRTWRAASCGLRWRALESSLSGRYRLGVGFGWRRVRPLAIGYPGPAAGVSSARARARLGDTMAPHNLVIPLSRAASCFEDVAGAGAPAPDSVSGPSSAVADAIPCRSSRSEASSDLRAGERQPLIDRSPSRIGTTWRQVADQFTPRGQVSRAAFAIRDGRSDRPSRLSRLGDGGRRHPPIASPTIMVRPGPRYGTGCTDADTDRCGGPWRCGVTGDEPIARRWRLIARHA